MHSIFLGVQLREARIFMTHVMCNNWILCPAKEYVALLPRIPLDKTTKENNGFSVPDTRRQHYGF